MKRGTRIGIVLAGALALSATAQAGETIDHQAVDDWKLARRVVAVAGDHGRWIAGPAGEAHMIAPCGLAVEWARQGILMSPPATIVTHHGTQTETVVTLTRTTVEGLVRFDQAGTYQLTAPGAAPLFVTTVGCE